GRWPPPSPARRSSAQHSRTRSSAPRIWWAHTPSTTSSPPTATASTSAAWCWCVWWRASGSTNRKAHTMNGEIAAILAMDGIASRPIYALFGFGLVRIFAVTRVIFVPFGDTAAFTAMSLASLETGGRPGTVGLVAVLAVLATVVEATALVRAGAVHRLPRALLFYLVLPLVPAAAVWFAAGTILSMPLRIVLSIALALPIAPLLDRIVFRPIADASVLLLLTVAVALHFALSGLALMFFGPQGVRTKPLTDTVFDVPG